MEIQAKTLRGFRLFLRMSMDWLCFAVVIMIALYSATFLIMTLSGA